MSLTSLAAVQPVPPIPAPGAALGPALRHALRRGRGHVVLGVEADAPHRRRLARALLQEGALAAGGQVLEGPDGALLLVGAEARRAQRLRGLLERLVGAAGTRLWSLERDAAALLAYAEGAHAPQPSAEGPDLAALDAWIAALPLAGTIGRRIGEGPEGLAFLRLAPDRTRIAAGLGPLGADADLLDHAEAALAARLLPALADPDQARRLLGGLRPKRLHLPLAALSGLGVAPPGLFAATLPVALLVAPKRLATVLATLEAAGIGTVFETLDAATLALLDPAALPAGLIRLAHGPGLDPAAIPPLDPSRLILVAEEAGAARAFARAAGIALVETAG
jgi:hypothetical protein